MPVEYITKPIGLDETSQKMRGWTLSVNGNVIKDVESAKFEQPKMGTVIDYGMRIEGYDGVTIKERGGGGSVIIPFFIDKTNQDLYIGVLSEVRPTATNGSQAPILNVPRGFLDPTLDHLSTAKNILGQEVGFTPVQNSIRELNGNPMNANSAYFVTDINKGVKAYSIEINPTELIETVTSTNPIDRQFRFDSKNVKPTSKMGEKIIDSRFIHWKNAVRELDMFTAASVGRLVADTIIIRKPKLESPKPKTENTDTIAHTSPIKRILNTLKKAFRKFKSA